MSTRSYHIVLVGQKIAGHQNDSKFKEIYDNEKLMDILNDNKYDWRSKNFRSIIDGMSGSYIFFGKILVEMDEFGENHSPQKEQDSDYICRVDLLAAQLFLDVKRELHSIFDEAGVNIVPDVGVYSIHHTT